MKVIVIEPTMPSRAVCQEKYLNVGLKVNFYKMKNLKKKENNLKFGALARSNARHAKFTPK
jgi:hypothetical protein